MLHKFSQFDFVEHDDKIIRIYFLKIFYFYVNKEEFKEFFGDAARIEKKGIETNLDYESTAEKLSELFSINQENLINKITNISTKYIHKGSGIPLIGSNVFGIVDRNTNILEVKPITGCNLKCTYCSLSEGESSIFEKEFVVDSDYLVEELKKVIEYKTQDNSNIKFEIHLGTHGEPTLFSDMPYFISKVSELNQVNRISINTNGVLLNEDSIKTLVDAGLNRFNISINSIGVNAKEIAGKDFYDSNKIKKNILFIDSLIKSGKYPDLELTLAPVLMKNINVEDIEEIIKWAKEEKINCRFGIQNFLSYRTGRRVDKVLDFNKFFQILESWEEKYDVKLILTQEDFLITKTKPLKKPFKKGEEFFVQILCKGRRKGEYLCVLQDRVVTVKSLEGLKGRVKIKITRTKHNVFDAEHIKKNKRPNCCKK